MGMAGPSLGRELRASYGRALSHTAPVPAWHRLRSEISAAQSRRQTAATSHNKQMVGGIKAISPGMKSMSADMSLDLPTMSAPSGEERKLRASAQVERAAGYASAASAAHSRLL